MVTASRDHDARIFEVATRRLVHVLNGHFGAVADASFSPDGRWIVTAGQTARAGLWEAESGRFLFYLRGHEGTLTSASFGPDSRRIVTASEDGTVRTFERELCGSVEELEALAEDRVSRLERTFTADERARLLDG